MNIPFSTFATVLLCGFWCEGRRHHENNNKDSTTPSPQTPPSTDYSFTNYIIEGSDVVRGSYPWVVHLGLERGGHCGGVLIHDEYVMTAAHCGQDQSPNRVVAEFLRHNLSLSVAADGAMTRAISTIINHPLYDPDSYGYDVGIWKLSSPINNINVAELDDGAHFHLGNELTVIGWGVTTPGGREVSEILQEIDIELIQCPSDYDVDRTEFCAGDEAGVYDSCTGDSGGPIFDSRDQAVVGIVSRGSSLCAQLGQPGIYAKISDRDILDFLSDVVFGTGESSNLAGETVTIDVAGEALLEHPDPRESGEFGHSVAVLEDVIAISAFFTDTNGFNGMGSTYIFNRQGSASNNIWRETQKLLPSPQEDDIHFGSAVLFSEEYPSLLFVGCRHDNENNGFGGAVYIYRMSGGTYSLRQKLMARGSSDGLGHSLSLSGGVLAAAGWLEVRFFEENSQGDWEETAVIFEDSWEEYVRVSLVGELLVVGAEDYGNDIGATYVYEKSFNTWRETAVLRPNSPNLEGAHFGDAVSVSSDQQRIAIGAPAQDELEDVLGTAYIYRKSGSSWVLEQEIRGSDTRYDDRFGESVLLHGNTLFVGSSRTPVGTLYIFERRDRWIEIDKIIPVNGEEYDRFGYSLAVSDDVLVVGGDNRDDGGGVAFAYNIL